VPLKTGHSKKNPPETDQEEMDECYIGPYVTISKPFSRLTGDK
jgi:hypothetical protein